MAQLLDKFSIISHDKQAFRIGVKASHIVQVAQLGRQEIINRTFRPLSLAAAYKTTRLVEQDNGMFFGNHVVSVQFYKIFGGNPYAGRFNNLAIHFHSTFYDQLIRCTAGINSA